MKKNQKIVKRTFLDADLSTYYDPPNPDIWQGRQETAAGVAQYWHQAVQCWPEEEAALPVVPEDRYAVALLGYAVEEGVRRNQGRVGTIEGPAAIRRQAARMGWHFGEELLLLDAGDIICPDGDLPVSQGALAAAAADLLTAGYFPIILGGGHDIAYGHYQGIKQHCAQAHPEARIGIINFDAHFDLRRPTQGPNSGTPFYQIAAEEDDFRYCVVGIQAAANPPELFATAEALGVEVITAQAVNLINWADLREPLIRFAANCDHLYLSIDLDGFSAAYAPGVSAPSPMGFTPDIIGELLAALFATGKVISMDIAELNPRFDLDDRTARLAARLVYAAVEAQRLWAN